MNNLNFIFLEEYKHLDKLCSELYDGQPGITSYINDMKSINLDNACRVPNWKADLSNLIRLRHIRNHLAHTEGAFNEKLCTNDDVDWVKDFRGRILKQDDPLAMLREHSHTPKSCKHVISGNGNNSSFWGDLFLVVSVVLVIIAMIYLVINMMF